MTDARNRHTGLFRAFLQINGDKRPYSRSSLVPAYRAL